MSVDELLVPGLLLSASASRSNPSQRFIASDIAFSHPPMRMLRCGVELEPRWIAERHVLSSH